MFKFLLYKFGQLLVRSLSIKFAYKIAIFVSDMQYYLSPRDRRAVRNNLKVIAATDKVEEKNVREVFRNFGRYLAEFFRVKEIVDEEYIKKSVSLHHFERIQKVLDQGKGGIVLTAHIGNWELGGIFLSRLGYPCLAIALPHKERPVNDLFNAQRETQGISIVPINNAVRKCIETLRSNKLVALLADRDFTLNGEKIDFLGRKALIPKGAAVFSYKTGAPIIPTFVTRNPDNTFSIFVEEPIYPPMVVKDQIEQEMLSDLIKKYAKVMEDYIRKYPTQWLMFREFFVQ